MATITSTSISPSAPSPSPSPFSTFQILLPFSGSVVGLGTIILVYYLTTNAGHLPKGITTPPISFLGCRNPEHTAYQIGFTLSGLMLLRCVEIWKVTFYPSIKRHNPISAFLAMLGGYSAVIGVIGQGVITLQEDFLEQFYSARGKLSLQSIFHQLLALFFFLGAASHCYVTCYLCYCTAKNTSSNDDTNFNWRDVYAGNGSRTAKAICALVSIISSPIAQLLHPTLTFGKNSSSIGIDVGGLAQYITVGSYIGFFGTYSLDLYHHHVLTTKKQE